MAKQRKYCAECDKSVYAERESNGCFITVLHIAGCMCTFLTWGIVWVVQVKCLPYRCPECGGICK